MGLLPLLSLNMDNCDFVIFPFNEGNCPLMFEQNLLFLICCSCIQWSFDYMTFIFCFSHFIQFHWIWKGWKIRQDSVKNNPFFFTIHR